MTTIAKASQQLLLDAINRDNGLTENPLTLEQMGLGLPIPTGVDNAFYNTYCTVYGLYGKGYHGSVKLSYQRYEMEKMFRGITPVLIIDPPPTKISEIIPALNDQYGLALAPEDIVDAPIAAGTTDGLVNLTMLSSNWAWLGTVRVRFAKTLPFITDLLPNTTLDAIAPVLPFTDKPVAEYVAYGYDFTGGYSVLTASLASAGKVITQDQFNALSNLSSLRFTMADGSTAGPNDISIAGGVWTGTVRADTSSQYNSTDYAYVNTLTLPATSNYAGSVIFQFNNPATGGV